MNVINLPPGPGSERLAQERPGMFSIVDPDHVFIGAMERALAFHRNPQPRIDYSGVKLTAEQAALVAAAEPVPMPEAQAAIHARAAEDIAQELGHLTTLDFELPDTLALDQAQAA